MDSQVLAAPLQVTSRRRRLLNAIFAALAGAAIAAAVLVANARDDSPSGPSATELRGPGFTIAYPSGWRPVPAATLPEGATAMIRRADGKGAVIVRPKAEPRDGSLRALTRDLNAGLGRRFADFQFVSSRVTRTRAGNAFLYTFVRTRAKTAQSIALVNVGSRHFTLDGVAATGDRQVAREVAAVVRSFGP
jgi:hypothetical protein